MKLLKLTLARIFICATVALFLINYLNRWRVLNNNQTDKSGALKRGHDKEQTVEKLCEYPQYGLAALKLLEIIFKK